MNDAIKIDSDIYWVGTNDFETALFESLWPLPEGVCYNSYLIMNDKVILIDLVKHTTEKNFIENISNLLNDKKVDYLIVNHMEPDHSGAMKILTKLYPEMKIIGNEKTISLINLFYGINTNCVCVKNEEVMEIGKNKFQFFLTPMVHWPESMATYEVNKNILFSSDIFGGFGTLNGGIFDDQVNLDFFENETRRYFSNIIGKYSQIAEKALAKLKNIKIKIIAPAHGPVFRKNPKHIFERYEKWSKQETECGVVIAYASMYGNTQVMAETVAKGLIENGIDNVKLYNVSKTHSSFIINDIWLYKGLILGSCTYNMQIFPYMNDLLSLLSDKNLINRYLGIFGSYSWSGGALKGLKDFASKSKLEIINPDIEAKCHPTKDDLSNCYLLGQNMAKKVLENFK